MGKIIVIAKNTFKETIRDRILYGILIFSLLFLLSTVIWGSLSLGEDVRIMKSFGLAGIYLFGMIITIFLGASVLYKETERGTIYFLISKPVKSFHIIVGKFLGLLSSIIVSLVFMAGVYLVVVGYNGGGFDYLVLEAIFLQVGETAVFISLLILLSTFSAPLASTIYAVLILYIGHLLPLLSDYASKISGVQKYFVLLAYYLLPNLEKFNIRNLVIYQATITASEIILPVVYAILYSLLALYAADILFRKKEF